MRRQDITEEQLLSALQALAVLIENYGPKYWPVFDRLDQELEKLKTRRRRLAIALKS